MNLRSFEGVVLLHPTVLGGAHVMGRFIAAALYLPYILRVICFKELFFYFSSWN